MLSGKIGDYNIIIKNFRRTHIRELSYFEMYLNDKLVGRVNYFSGRDYYVPWIEIDYIPWPRQEDIEVELFKYFYNLLTPNSRLFVTYENDKETSDLIFKGYSAADTPLGFSMLKAGFTWFKIWYFPEGGNEGSPKIQGNKPLNEESREKELLELLDEVKNPRVKEWILHNVKRKS